MGSDSTLLLPTPVITFKKNIMSTSKVNVFEALNNAHDEGTLSQASLTALTNIRDIGEEIQNGLGVPVDQIGASEVVLISLLIDDSGSMDNNIQAVLDGYDTLIKSLNGAKQQDNIQVMVRYLNKGLVFPFTPLSHAGSISYTAGGSTPLFKETATTLGTIITKLQEFEDNGIQARSVCAILTDGGDNASGSTTASDVEKIVKDMLQTEKHIIAGMGFDDGWGTDFNEVFKSMGLKEAWIYTDKSGPSEIRKGFQLMSQSAARASQSGAAFSATAMQGFGS